MNASDSLRVFRCLQKAGLTLKRPKCQFGLNHVHYLGYLIGEGGVRPDPEEVEAVLAYQKPETRSDVSAFLGLTGYYCKFVPGYASIAAPLTDLLKKGRPEHVVWSTACHRAFEELKEHLVKKPILRVPDPKRKFIVQTDASASFGLSSYSVLQFSPFLLVWFVLVTAFQVLLAV